MATVYITDDLIKRVNQRISTMRMAERSSDLPDIDKTAYVDASMLFNIGCWGAQHVHLVDLIPKDWLSKNTDASITIAGWTDEAVHLKTSVRFNGMTFAYNRPKDGYYSRYESEMTLDELRAFPEETIGRAELLKRWDDAVIELSINARWAKVATDITEFLKKCKSLNEAIKLFPNVAMYIHYDDMERFNRKIERAAQRKDIVKSYDTDGLTAAAIAAKLAEAS